MKKKLRNKILEKVGAELNRKGFLLADSSCGTKWRNIIFAKQMHHIAVGDASLDKHMIM